MAKNKNHFDQKKLAWWMIGLVTAVILLSLLAAFFWPSSAQAASRGEINWGDNWHEPRARVLLHNTRPVNDYFDRQIDVVIDNVVNQERLPVLAYLGFKTHSQAFNWQCMAGYHFLDSQWIASVQFGLDSPRFYTWSIIEARPDGGAYHFSQFQSYTGWDFVDFGLETESWGNLDSGGWTHGLGPNVLFYLLGRNHKGHQVNLDVSVHYRDLEEEWKPEFFLRLHIIPRLDL